MSTVESAPAVVRIVEPLCKISGNQATVVVEGGADQIEQLSALPTREAVVRWAQAHGIGSRCGVSTTSGPYPVDAEGRTDEDLIRGQREVAAYRNSYTVLGMP